MSSWIEDKRSGQTLVLVALLMVVLLGFVALAIDVGNIYSVRRHMQNAADAGALAGAREICFGNPSQWEVKAREYAITRNGAGAASVFERPSYWRVKVTARTTAQTFVAGIVGLDTVDVPAVAVAACGEAQEACGLWPVAFDRDLWNSMTDNGEDCDKLMYVWDDDAPNADPPDCDLCECDIDGDGVDDIAAIEGRAWVDFSGSLGDPDYYPDECWDRSSKGNGCGTKEIKCWLLHDGGAKIAIGACINGTTGGKIGAKNEVKTRPQTDPVVAIPLYSYMGCPPDAGKTCGSGETFKVADWACLTAVGWEQQLQLDCADGSKWKGKAIVAEVNCGGCTTNCGSTSGIPPDPSGIRTVSLIQ